jgi:hypothetical protein
MELVFLCAAALILFGSSLAMQVRRRERREQAELAATCPKPAQPSHGAYMTTPTCHPPYDHLVQTCRDVLACLRAINACLQQLEAALPNDAEPPQQLALQGRWFEHCRQHTPQALIHQLAIALGRDGAAEPEFTRVGGAALCETCGTSYYNHPRHPFYSCLTIACDGRILKT